MKKFGLRALCGFFFITNSSAMENNQLTVVDSIRTKEPHIVTIIAAQNKRDTKSGDKKSDQNTVKSLHDCTQYLINHVNPTIGDPEKVKAVLIAKMH